jgi:hypothetical protein
VIVRGQTVRMDLQYEVDRAVTSDFISEVIGRLQDAFQVQWFCEEIAARAIVYCQTKANARAIADALGCLCYCADSGTEEEKAEILTGWMDGDSRVGVATSAFVEGILDCLPSLGYRVKGQREYEKASPRGGSSIVPCKEVSKLWVMEKSVPKGW